MKQSKAQGWNLSDLYDSMDDPAITKDLQKADFIISNLEKYRGKIAAFSPSAVLNLIQQEEELGFIFHKIDLYAGLLESTRVADPVVTRFVKKTNETLIREGQRTIFIGVEFAQLSEKKWLELLHSTVLKPYAHYLSKVYQEAKHTLSENEEKILAEKSQTSALTLQHLFSITTNTLQFSWERKKITLDDLLTKFHHPSPKVRKKAAQILHKGLKQNNKTTPAIYNALVQDKAINDELRRYDFHEQARYMHDDVDRETVTALIAAVNGSFPTVERYYALKKRIMNIEQLFWWDRYAPLPEMETRIDQADAQRMVHEAYNEFSPELSSIVAEMYDLRHIDWMPSPSKQGGAFCAFGGNKIYPYVLLNYTETPRDVMTLAHELGHAVHDVLAQKNNVFLQTHPSLAAAEIASVFGESLLFEKLIQSDIAKRDKISLMMSFIEDTFATVFRQITMFQFEQQIHDKRQKEGELSQEEIDTLWHETMQKPYGQALTFTDEHRNTWMYIPHIINTPFYVYSYAFAQLCVLSLIAQYKEQGKSFVPTYLKLLKAGGSLSPKDNLAQAGLDINDKSFWKNGLQLINSYLEDLEILTS